MKTSRKLIFGKSLLIAFISTLVVTVLLVYFTGLNSHRSIIDNSLISLTVVAACLFTFLVFGLYNGLNVVDNLSHKLQISWRNRRTSVFDGSGSMPSIEVPDLDVGDGIGGIILSILFWIAITIALVVLLAFFEVILWALLLLLFAAFYWVFIRALKLIFSRSEACRGDLPKSVTYALGYTALYIGWLYAVIFVATLV